jgi:DNA invertase Pin-like site-specific DNA recombinase
MSGPNDSRAIAYLRRSRVDEARAGAISFEAQEAAVRLQAKRWGFDDVELVVDWGRSGGRGKESRRAGYMKLRDLIEAGQVTDVFSYDLARLTRSLTEWTRLADLATDRGVRIHLVKEGDFDFSTASGEMLANILASVAQAVRRWASERSKETITALRARGDSIGRKRYGSRPGEDLDFVTSAYREAGSFLGAARLLNERQVANLKRKTWTPSAVAWILRQQAPELVHARPSVTGPARPGRFALSKLVYCHCGRLLTPYSYRNGRNPTYTVYRCAGGRADPAHPRPYAVSDAVLLSWAKDEAARLLVPASAVRVAEERGAERAELDARRLRILDMYEAGHVSREDRDARLTPLYEQLERLDREAGAETLADIPVIDWTWPPDRLNTVLRAVWERIDVDEELRPVRAEWHVPEWRAG